MPEGDTLRRAEALLSPALEGRIVTNIWFRKLRGYRPRVGQRIESVDAVGKYLLIEFDRRLTLRTHLGMAGSWRVVPPDAELPRSPRLRVVVATEAGIALCFSAPTIDTFVRSEDSPSPLDHLGPDLSDDLIDLDLVVPRIRELAGGRLLAEALLDQRVAAGVGNVFKSEVAFLAGIHPFTPIAQLSDAQLQRVWRIAHRQMVDNRDRPTRRTTSVGIRDRTHVYDRFRKACHRCFDSILYSAAGQRTERSTYWCPRCQPLESIEPAAPTPMRGGSGPWPREQD